MKKLLLASTVLALGVAYAAPVHAQVKLDLGGHFKGYGAWVDQDEASDIAATAGTNENVDVRALDIQRETEIHFTGETTLDNGLTVGFHAEADIDTPDTFSTEEAYAYFSGAWGRVNFGREDGAAYLLQVAAPSADSNMDGIRQYVQPVNFPGLANANVVNTAGTANPALGDFLGATGAGTDLVAHDILVDVGAAGASAGDIRVGTLGVLATLSSALATNPRLDYDQALSGTANKFTYLTPVFNGFQAGFSYTPDTDSTSRDWSTGNNQETASFEAEGYDVAARYEGQFGELGLAVGAGYSHVENDLPASAAPLLYVDNNADAAFTAGTDTVLGGYDDQKAWNVGLDLNWGPFGIGAVYLDEELGLNDVEADTWVVGVDYTTGPFKLGASYYEQDTDILVGDLEAERWSAGVTYTYGPGMTFRGSVSFVDVEESVGATSTDGDATSVLLGTQIDF